MDNSTWIVTFAHCKDCKSNLIICQASEKYADYWWYCSNKNCKNHHPGAQLGDQESCEFAERNEKSNG